MLTRRMQMSLKEIALEHSVKLTIKIKMNIKIYEEKTKFSQVIVISFREMSKNMNRKKLLSCLKLPDY